ncbi:GntR family transcriptional regulator [Holdemania massiliensis]|uniref:GntR family transcriptional regulator n=1 Tax=Holdemania massiliensis TaxID=1468449 RepID=UPI001F056706|nr:GntR family transcriptional regulator [Holdemania massiliensis]MCH1942034.1 GntR family transcriptional regulator [Holdemania massiliensis]
MSKNALSNEVYHFILDQIFSCQLKPGEKIAEVTIAEQFGISRTPIREALRLLSNDGLIDLVPNRYAAVAQFTDQQIQEIGTIRISLDVLALRLAMLNGSRREMLELRDIAQSCFAAYQNQDGRLRRRFDADFHTKLSQISGNELLCKMQNELYLRIQFILLHQSQPEEEEEKHLLQHFEIVDAMLQGDQQKALSVILDHLLVFYHLEDTYPKDFFLLSPALK